MTTRQRTTTTLDMATAEAGHVEIRHVALWDAVASLHRLLLLCLVLACVGASWFTYQLTLVPHATNFAPDWQNAQWVQATPDSTPVAYYRYSTSVNALPDGAFVTIAANQVFRLYVNGIFIGTNLSDFTQGNFPRAYMYDIESPVRLGHNVIALRVANVDGQTPTVRVSMGLVHGQTVEVHGTVDRSNGWLATSDSSAVHHRYDTSIAWAGVSFDDSNWLPVRAATQTITQPMLTINPLVYEQPIPTQWMSAGTGHEAYFVRQLALPWGTSGTWLRLIATGSARVFINGHLLIVWNGQAAAQPQSLADYVSTTATAVQYRSGLVLGVYDITPYVHPGLNTIAVHVSVPGVSASRAGLEHLNTALATDVLNIDLFNHATWAASRTDWHTAYRPVDGWMQGSSAALGWSHPLAIGRPGTARAFYLSDISNPRSQQYIPPTLLLTTLFWSIASVIGLWCVMGLGVFRRYYTTTKHALEVAALAFLPALAIEALLIVLAREPQMPQPFPYTWPWAMLLVSLVGGTYVLLWLNAQKVRRQEQWHVPSIAHPLHGLPALLQQPLTSIASLFPTTTTRRRRVIAWLRAHWALLVLMLLALPLISYNLSYEPYWQDELTSYYAAKGILAHGLPLMPSGFLYPKGELYSYLLALFMALFGDQHGTPRLLSVLEYMIGLPVLYGIGCYFFNRRIALLATAMLAFSPVSLVWGRQVRMYEQAQLLTMIVIYLFYRAVNEPKRPRLIYLAFGALLADYLSHEETFIILPAIALCVVGMYALDYLRHVIGQVNQDSWMQDSWARTSHRPYYTTDEYGRLSSRTFFHWLLGTALCAAIIGLQLLVVHYSHPPLLGTDQSQRPFVQFTTDNVPFYLYLLFYSSVLAHGALPWMTLNSLLAVAGCIMAARGDERRAKYCMAFLLTAFATLVFAFTMSSDRYFYPLLSLYYLLGAYAMLTGLRSLWAFARSRLVLPRPEPRTRAVPEGYLPRPMQGIAAWTLGVLCLCVLVLPLLPISGYSLFVSKEIGFAYHKHYPDYDAASRYMQQHWQKGDIVVTIAPAISILYYSGHVDYFFSVDRALYLFERNGQIVDTPTGSTPLLNQQDFQALVASHARIWIVTDNGMYQAEVTKNRRFVFPPDFRLVYEGYGSAIYFRGN